MTSHNEQQWDPIAYQQHGRFVSDLGASILDLLEARTGERILDLGCGDGALTRKLVDMGCDVLGVDSSTPMVEATRALGVEARMMDGQSLDFHGEFDAVFSNAALHWMPHAEHVLAGVWRALKPGGRFVAEFGGHGNVATIVNALHAALAARHVDIPNPWFFPTPEHYRALLEKQGFQVHFVALLPRPTLLPGDVRAWLTTFAQPLLSAVAEEERPACLAALADTLRASMCDADGKWWADYMRIRCHASKA
ncbi:class I SAM-dependent methyltransferase [Dyella caseinilytica]|uniref:Class I SAM-dependent methyltransferase n=1 Tax=Dyella caseinilytica TaxID=1849581 RepID=A0ABX7GTV9_9GAMM|nr:class I SAM-dependent methyltransferase [Dyella caseinilytica]QRN53891.1 class I SAM-dependent methyltransferase [Dyella caseinilytica]GFZ89904.1 methyltransferase type 11 [Dyella caseinilytica]